MAHEVNPIDLMRANQLAADQLVSYNWLAQRDE